jgi:hypothetical protein
MIDTKQLDAAFFALSDPTRRAILTRLASGEATVGELTEPKCLRKPGSSGGGAMPSGARRDLSRNL